MAKRYSSILETIGNTPVVRDQPAWRRPGVNLYVKVEAFNPLGSVKDRLALGVIEAAEKSGELKPGQTVDRGDQRQHRHRPGHGLRAPRAIRWCVTMAETFSVERRKLMRFLGAKVVLTPAAERGVGMVTKAVELAEDARLVHDAPVRERGQPRLSTRARPAREIVDDFAGERLDYWVTGYGTGGTLKGVARVLAQGEPETKIIVCEPEDAPLLGSGIAAGAQCRRHARRAAPGLQAAPDAGLDAGLHPEADRRRRRHEGHRPASCTIPGAGGDALQPRTSPRRKASSSASPRARPSPAR